MDKAYRPPYLDDLVRSLTYKKGWRMYLETDISEDGSGGLTFFVISVTDDSMVKDKKISVRHGFLVPLASYNRDSWAAWLRDRMQDVETHECNEFFRIDGLREFAPHHGNGEDPYRTWHVSDYATARKRAGEA